MLTYTHLLLSVVLVRPLRARIIARQERLPPFRTEAFLWGSVLPDLPLILTTLVCCFTDALRRNGEKDDGNGQKESWTHQLFSVWYFHSPWVKAEHNIFHSPVSLLFLIGTTFFVWKCYDVTTVKTKTKQIEAVIAPWCFWTFTSCLFHAACDIPVHHDDGPLLLFPLNWNVRFHSPVSYYDSDYYGVQFAVTEHMLDFAILIGECRRRLRNSVLALDGAAPSPQDDDEESEINTTTTWQMELTSLIDKVSSA